MTSVFTRKRVLAGTLRFTRRQWLMALGAVWITAAAVMWLWPRDSILGTWYCSDPFDVRFSLTFTSDGKVVEETTKRNGTWSPVRAWYFADRIGVAFFSERDVQETPYLQQSSSQNQFRFCQRAYSIQFPNSTSTMAISRDGSTISNGPSHWGRPMKPLPWMGHAVRAWIDGKPAPTRKSIAPGWDRPSREDF